MHNASRASVSVWVLVVVAAESMMFINNDSEKKTKKETQKEKGSENLHVMSGSYHTVSNSLGHPRDTL